jgi:predicted enzyme related to lactoylglutathione lyase
MSTFTKPKTPGTPTWFDLTTPDVAKSRDFYAALFGWTYTINGPEMGYYSVGRLGGRQAAGMGQPPPGSDMPSAWSVMLASHDIQADADRLKALGGQVLAGPMQIAEEGWMVMANDPTGAVFGLWQAGRHIGATVTDEPGSMTWCEVNTRDAVKARGFFCDLFDLAWSPMEGMEYYLLKRGEANLAGVMQMDHNWPAELPPHWMPYFAVSNTEQTARLAVQHGGKVGVEPFDSPYGRIAVLNDPFGAWFSVVAMTSA